MKPFEKSSKSRSPESRTVTLGINFPPAIASAIRRAGNRKNSISQQLFELIDPEKLEQLVRDENAFQQKCHNN